MIQDLDWQDPAALAVMTVALAGLAVLGLSVPRYRPRPAAGPLLAMVASYSIFIVRDLSEVLARILCNYAPTPDCEELVGAIHRLWPVGEAALTAFAMSWVTFSWQFTLVGTAGRRAKGLHAAFGAFSALLVLEMLANMFVPLQTSLGPAGLTWEHVYIAHWIVVFALAIGSSAVVARRYLHSKSITVRRHMKWLAWGMATATVLAIFGWGPSLAGVHSPAQLVPAYEHLPVTLLVWSQVYAVRRVQRLNVDLIISRSLVYLSLLLILSALYVSALLLWARVFQSDLAGRGLIAPAFLASLVAGLSSSPLRNLLQAGADRLFQKDKYDYRSSVRDFSVKLNGNLDVQSVVETVTDTARTCMRTTKACTLLLDRGEGILRLAAARGIPPGQEGRLAFLESEISKTDLASKTCVLPVPKKDPEVETGENGVPQLLARCGFSLCTPLRKNGELIGLLALGDMVAQDMYTPEDFDLLSTIASQASIAISNARLYRELELLSGELQDRVAERTCELELANQELQRLHQDARRQAITDGLTGLFNYRHFHNSLSRAIQVARESGSEVSLLFLDIDDFKSVNDRLGHLGGDHVLRSVATIIKSNARPVDTPSRYGGDEFALLLPGVPKTAAAQIAARLSRCIQDHEVTVPDGPPVRTTASIGFSTYPEDGDTPEDILRAADGATYTAKERRT